METYEILVKEIFDILNQLQSSFEQTNEINGELREIFYDKIKQLPNGHKIKNKFDEIFDFGRDEGDKSLASKESAVRGKRSVFNSNQPSSVAPAGQFSTIQPQRNEIEKKQTCVELFADFGSFFNRTISKVGIKYCSESEIVRRID